MRRVPVAVSALTVIAGNAFFGKVGAKAKECRKRRADLIRTTFTWDEYHIAVFPSYKTVARGQSVAAGRYRLKEQANN